MNAYTIYYGPADYPGRYVVRRFLIEPGEARPREVIAVADGLEAARAAVPPGLAMIPRSEGDAPGVVETWL